MRPLGGHEISALLPASGRVMQQRRVWLVCGCVACVVLADEHNVFADRQDSFGGCGAIRASVCSYVVFTSSSLFFLRHVAHACSEGFCVRLVGAAAGSVRLRFLGCPYPWAVRCATYDSAVLS